MAKEGDANTVASAKVVYTADTSQLKAATADARKDIASVKAEAQKSAHVAFGGIIGPGINSFPPTLPMGRPPGAATVAASAARDDLIVIDQLSDFRRELHHVTRALGAFAIVAEGVHLGLKAGEAIEERVTGEKAEQQRTKFIGELDYSKPEEALKALDKRMQALQNKLADFEDTRGTSLRASISGARRDTEAEIRLIEQQRTQLSTRLLYQQQQQEKFRHLAAATAQADFTNADVSRMAVSIGRFMQALEIRNAGYRR